MSSPASSCVEFIFISSCRCSKPQTQIIRRPFAIDIVVHPRDLNLLFLAYSGKQNSCVCEDSIFKSVAGGIVLYDIVSLLFLSRSVSIFSHTRRWFKSERRPIRHYVLLLPPGAPGGTGYSDKVGMKMTVVATFVNLALCRAFYNLVVLQSHALPYMHQASYLSLVMSTAALRSGRRTMENVLSV